MRLFSESEEIDFNCLLQTEVNKMIFVTFLGFLFQLTETKYSIRENKLPLMSESSFSCLID